jgi:hypothetical protein
VENPGLLRTLVAVLLAFPHPLGVDYSSWLKKLRTDVEAQVSMQALLLSCLCHCSACVLYKLDTAPNKFVFEMDLFKQKGFGGFA